jgi:hypothetical protein
MTKSPLTNPQKSMTLLSIVSLLDETDADDSANIAYHCRNIGMFQISAKRC